MILAACGSLCYYVEQNYHQRFTFFPQRWSLFKNMYPVGVFAFNIVILSTEPGTNAVKINHYCLTALRPTEGT